MDENVGSTPTTRISERTTAGRMKPKTRNPRTTGNFLDTQIK